MSNLKEVIEEALLSCKIYQSDIGINGEVESWDMELNNFFDLRQIELMAIHIADKVEPTLDRANRISMRCMGCGDHEE